MKPIIIIPDNLIVGKLQCTNREGYKRCAIGVLLFHAGVDPLDLEYKSTCFGKFKCEGFQKELTGFDILEKVYGLTISQVLSIQDDNDNASEDDRVTIFEKNLIINNIPYQY